MSSQRGFSLLEVMVALAVFALLAAATGSASAYVLGQQQGLRDRLLAAWLADNHVAELRLSGPSAPGNRQYRARMDARDWHLDAYQGSAGDDTRVPVSVSVRLEGASSPLYRTNAWLGGRDGQP